MNAFSISALKPTPPVVAEFVELRTLLEGARWVFNSDGTDITGGVDGVSGPGNGGCVVTGGPGWNTGFYTCDSPFYASAITADGFGPFNMVFLNKFPCNTPPVTGGSAYFTGLDPTTIIVVDGNSLAAGVVGNADSTNRVDLSNILTVMLRNPAITIENVAVGGQTIWDMITRIEPFLAPQLQRGLAGNIVIAYGEPGNGLKFGSYASATLISPSNLNPVDGDIVSIGGKDYTARNSPTTEGDFRIYGSWDLTLAALIKAVDQTGVSGTDYVVAAVNPLASSLMNVGAQGTSAWHYPLPVHANPIFSHSTRFVNLVHGTVGNSTAVGTTSAHLAWYLDRTTTPTTTLAGGIDPGSTDAAGFIALLTQYATLAFAAGAAEVHFGTVPPRSNFNSDEWALIQAVNAWIMDATNWGVYFTKGFDPNQEPFIGSCAVPEGSTGNNAWLTSYSPLASGDGVHTDEEGKYVVAGYVREGPLKGF